jgi:hypothetical protein
MQNIVAQSASSPSEVYVLRLPMKLGLIEEKNEMIRDTIDESIIKKWVSQALIKEVSYTQIELFDDTAMDTAKLYTGFNASEFNFKNKKSKLAPELKTYLNSVRPGKWLLVIIDGFRRTDKNYRSMNAKGAAGQLLSLGMYANYPIRTRYSLITIYIDTQNEPELLIEKSEVSDKPFDALLFEKLVSKQIKFFRKNGL